jgi:hypothetical protein
VEERKSRRKTPEHAKSKPEELMLPEGSFSRIKSATF